ncbi:hypothetical protein DPMN_044949 [Dreissena polymorpha]|uniref:Secreted protein n=1 Tax=Dreissena polymorpha TaxID=45954 RepID=A0A9D4D369_DREPO|nr:hypothetical protein DPMN_044949 [Dreissena polymorpha]
MKNQSQQFSLQLVLLQIQWTQTLTTPDQVLQQLPSRGFSNGSFCEGKLQTCKTKLCCISIRRVQSGPGRMSASGQDVHRL